jgi:MFS family permease
MAMQRLGKIPPSIWVLGGVSMLMDVSSELIHGLLPAFLVSVLGASAFSVGLIEGAAESAALITKVFSGALSDYLGKRKLPALIGYGFSALSKPMFALATGVGMVFAARFMDRIGKGIRGAPRDALVADLTPVDLRGAAYGLRQSLDNVGAVIGPLLAVGLMWLWSNDIRAVLWVAVFPAVFAVALLFVGVREPVRPPRAAPVNPIRWRELKRLGADYWWVVAIGAIITLARFSEAFLVLRAQQNGLQLAWVPLVLVTMNIVYAASAYPFGMLSDTVSHARLLIAGIIVLIAADLALAAAQTWSVVFIGVALWGLHLGFTQGLLASMVAGAAPVSLRGTAFGYSNLLSGIAMLLASALAGFLWDRYGPAYTFYAGAGFCALAITVIAIKSPDKAS